MSVLMPQGGVRHCECKHKWFTTHVAKCACPKCGRDVPESDMHWFVCAAGHSGARAGECQPCLVLASAKQAKEERRAAAVAEWVDR